VSSRFRSIGWRLAVPLVSAAGGLLCVSSAMSADGIDLRAGTTDLTQVVVDRSRQVAQLRAEQREVRDDIRQLSAGLDDVDVDAAAKEVAKLSPAAGLTAVRGEGLVVVLTDTPRDAEVPEGIDPNLLVVHQQDIQASSTPCGPAAPRPSACKVNASPRRPASSVSATPWCSREFRTPRPTGSSPSATSPRCSRRSTRPRRSAATVSTWSTPISGCGSRQRIG
jgi:hypothetical protein